MQLLSGNKNEGSRLLCIITAGISKIGFLLLILIFGATYIDKLMVTVVFDSIVVLILATYVVSSRRAVG
jgi:energy-converting hydrogenase Eha subunit C